MKWDEYFMRMAHHVATRSKDPSTKVGAVIVDASNRIVSTGYNGAPRGTNDAHVDRDTRLKRTLHAELNAVLFAQRDLRGCTLYVTHHPCCQCAAVIVQVGIECVKYPPVPAAFADRWYEQMAEAQHLLAAGEVRRVVVHGS